MGQTIPYPTEEIRGMSSKFNHNKRTTSMNIFVGNLSPEVTEDELRQEFAGFGEVTSVTIRKDQYRAYAFVEMARHSQGETTITGLNGKTLRNRVLSVIEALPLSHGGVSGSYPGKTSSTFSGRVRNGR